MRKTNRIIRGFVIIALIFTMTLLLTACSGSSVPDAEDAKGEVGDLTWEYTKDNNKLTIRGEGEIPNFESSEDVPWAKVRHSVKFIDLSADITSIGDFAFYYMPELTDVDIPDGVTSIGAHSFAFCRSLKSIALPDVIATIGDGAFEACASLEAVSVFTAVTEIGEKAFAHCTALSDVLILGDVSIGELTFKNCTSLENVTFNAGITEDKVAENAFEGAKLDYTGVKLTQSIDATAKLTINYVFENGEEASPSHIEEAKEYGAVYAVPSPEIEGYIADQSSVSGIVKGEDIVETVTYKVDPATTEAETEEADAPADTDTSDEEEEPSKVVLIISVVILAIVLIGIGVGGFLLVRSDKEPKSQTVVKKNNDTKGKNGKNGKNNGKKK